MEIKDLEPGIYYIYLDIDWQPHTFTELPKNIISFSLNCYGIGEVEFGTCIAKDFNQNTILDHMLNAYCIHHVENETKMVKVDDKTYSDQDITVYSEASVWKTGYRFKLFKNSSEDSTFIYTHSFLDFKNGLIIQEIDLTNKMIVGRSQVALLVENTPKGFYCKVYKGYAEG